MDIRPQCTCEKSECLQRYCHCFEGRYYCNEDCSCRGCRNTEENADEVDEHADSISTKRPEAFKPKVIAGDGSGLKPQQLQLQQDQAMEHVNGCHCRRSECKKLYCECFKHRVGCTSKCNCIGCANMFGVKGALVPAAQADDDSPNGTSGGSGATFGSSDVDNMLGVPADQAGMVDDFSAIPVPGDWNNRGGGLGDMFQSFKGGNNFEHNVDPQRHQGFAQHNGSLSNDPNSVLRQDPSNSNTCRLNHDNQINKFGGSGATFAGSAGVSPTVNDMLNVLANQASMVDGFSPNPFLRDRSNWCANPFSQAQSMGEGDLDLLFQHLKNGDNFQHNVVPQRHQGFAQDNGSLGNDANAVLWQDPSNSDTCRLNHDSDWSNLCADHVSQTRAMGGGGPELMFQHFKDGDNFQHNVDPQRDQGFAQDHESLSNDANSVLRQDPSNFETCSLDHHNQINRFGGF